MEQYRMYIGGEFTESVSGRWMDSENPFSGEVWAKVAQGSAEDAGHAVQAAHQAFTHGPWSQLTASQRGLLMHKVGDLILRDARKLAEAEVRVSGRTINEVACSSASILIAFPEPARGSRPCSDSGCT